MYIIRCSQEFPKMALASLLAYNPSVTEITQGLYYSKTNNQTHNLAQVTHVYEHIYTGSLEHSPLSLTDKTFSVRTKNCSENEKSKAQAFIYYSQKKPCVQLDNPEAEYFAQKISDDVFIFGKLLLENKTKYHINTQKHVANFKPITLPKKLARTFVNLSGVTNGIIHDPFCGFGAIPFEALECGNTVIGSDIDTNMLEGAKEYTQKFSSNRCTFINESALKTTIKSDAIVSDLPFGKATKNISLTLYKDFLLHVKRTKITKKLVLGFPDFHKPLDIIHECGLETKHVFSIYIHKSLSRIIVVIDIE